MPDLKLLISADDKASKSVAEISGRLKDAGNGGKEFGKKVQEGSKKADEALKKTKDTAKKVEGGFDKLATIIKTVFAGAAARAVLRFGSESSTMFAQQSRAVDQLSLAMNNLGVGTTGALKDQVEFASGLEKTTNVSSQAILNVQALLTSFGLYGEDLKSATKTTLDFSAATETSLSSSARQIGRAFLGNAASLKRFGVVVDESKPKAEQFADAIEALNSKFGGRASRNIGDHIGQVEALGHQYGNLKETLGAELIPVANFWIATLGKIIAATKSAVSAGRENLSVNEQAVAQIQDELKALANAAKAQDEITFRKHGSFEAINKEIEIKKRLLEQLFKEIRAQEKSEDAAAKAAAARFAAAKAAEEAAAKEAALVPLRLQAQQELSVTMNELLAERLELEGNAFEAEKLRINEATALKLESLMQQHEAGLINGEQLEQASVLLQENQLARIDQLREANNATYQAMMDVAKNASKAINKSFGDGVADMIVDGKDLEKSLIEAFKNIAKQAIQQLISIAIQAMITKAAVGFVTGGAGFLLGAGGTMVAQRGTRRVPGPVGVPVPAIVHGGETINTAGTPSSAGSMGGGGGGGGNSFVIHMNLKVSNLDPSERQRVLMALTDEIRRASNGAERFAGELGILQSKVSGRSS